MSTFKLGEMKKKKKIISKSIEHAWKLTKFCVFGCEYTEYKISM